MSVRKVLLCNAHHVCVVTAAGLTRLDNLLRNGQQFQSDGCSLAQDPFPLEVGEIEMC